MSSLSGAQFYHGGGAVLDPGDLVLPSRVHGQHQTTGNGTSYAWATTDPVEAAGYAKRYARDTGQPGHVYRVRTIDGDTRQPDDAKGGHAQGRETGWLVENHAWSTESQDTERIDRASRRASSERSLRRRLQDAQRPAPKHGPMTQRSSETVDEIMRLLG